ncbi:Domain of unknown function (DUF383) [Nesidiocoris tenuis]|nr:Domain of unknown function (DUF383) [Nesidiocoris tenuis]
MGVVAKLIAQDDDCRLLMVEHLLSLSSQSDGVSEIIKNESLVEVLLDAAKVGNVCGNKALQTLINVSASSLEGARRVAKVEDGLAPNVKRLLDMALTPESPTGDNACIVLANVTRYQEIAEMTVSDILATDRLDSLVNAVCDKAHNRDGQRLEYSAHVLGNLCQSKIFRAAILDASREIMSRVLPVIHTSPSAIERRGVASAVFNCLLDPSTHEILLSPTYDILTVLLLPLAGPEEFDMDEYDKMPVQLQFLPADKTREADPDLRNILLCSLLRLCSTRNIRTQVRDSNAYLILREYHKWETDRSNLLAAENVIDLLIRTEDEIGVDDVSSLDVPDDLVEKFEKMDKDFISDE